MGDDIVKSPWTNDEQALWVPLRKAWRALTKCASPAGMNEGVHALVQNRPAARGRGRPRQFDPDHGVAIALDLFRAHGYDRVTLSDLTGAIGINPPSFYAAFGNKALLFIRIADRYATEWLAEVREAFEAAPTLEAALDAVVMRAAARFAWQDDTGNGWGGCLILESARNCSDAGVVAHLRKARLSVAAALYRGISRWMPEQVVSLTDHVMTLLAGLSAMGRDGVRQDRLTSVASRAVRALSGTAAQA